VKTETRSKFEGTYEVRVHKVRRKELGSKCGKARKRGTVESSGNRAEKGTYKESGSV